MRSWIASMIVVGVAAPAAAEPLAEPLAEAELRLGYGVALGGSGGMTSGRASPLTIGAVAAIAVREEPALAAYGGLVVETLDRYAAGATGGVRLARGRLRLAAGGTAIVAPRTLWGATARGGACHAIAPGVRACGDLELTSFVAGSDLAEGRTVTQVQAVLGMVFDAM